MAWKVTYTDERGDNLSKATVTLVGGYKKYNSDQKAALAKHGITGE